MKYWPLKTDNKPDQFMAANNRERDNTTSSGLLAQILQIDYTTDLLSNH